MAQRVRRAIPPAKSFSKSAGRCVRDHAPCRGSMAHISARIHTRGQSFCRLRHARRHRVIFGVFWHGITHGRTRLLSEPARRGTLEARSYLTSTVFFRLVMTGQLLEANWGRVWRQNKPPLFFSDSSIKILYRGERLELNQIHLIPQSPLLHHSDLLQQTSPITTIMPMR